jgi:hypothetical protein
MGHDRYHVKSTAGQYLSATPDGELTIERRQAAEWEAFTISPEGPGTFSIRTVHGKYILAQSPDSTGRTAAHADNASEWEMFAIEQQQAQRPEESVLFKRE